MNALLAYRDRPEQEIEPIKTNWTVVPANTNADPEEIVDYSFERQILIMPSVQEIMRHVEAGSEERNDTGQIIKIGDLRFSDGSNTERAYCYGLDGKLIQYDARMPAGAMLGTRDKADRQLGGRGDGLQGNSGAHLAELLKCAKPRYIKSTGRRNGKALTRDESAIELAKAYANTPVLPAITKCEPGLPCGSPKPADCFIGMRKGKKGESGAIAWEDIATSIVSREVWTETLAALSGKDKRTLDKAMKAKTMADLGGKGHRRNAERRGKQRLIAANDNLMKAMALAS